MFCYDQAVHIVLVHGAGGSEASWGDLAQRLRANGHEVDQPMCRGFLERPAVGDDITLDFAHDVAELVRPDTVLVGHSWGSLVVRLALWQCRPAAVVLVSPAGASSVLPGPFGPALMPSALVPSLGKAYLHRMRPRSSALQRLALAQVAGDSLSPDQAESLLTSSGAVPIWAHWRALGSVFKHAPSLRVTRVDVVWGTQDWITQPALIRVLVRRWEREGILVNAHEWHGCGHSVAWERPQELIDVIEHAGQLQHQDAPRI